jgi:hypothetical protein
MHLRISLHSQLIFLGWRPLMIILEVISKIKLHALIIVVFGCWALASRPCDYTEEVVEYAKYSIG